jgi:hypothetical protein
MEILFLWLVPSFVIGWGGTQKGRSFWFGFLWSFLLTPILGLLIVLLSRRVSAEERAEKERGDLKGGMNI